jgi:3-hydroxybutyryl-CoA dehydrogenase
MDQEIFSLIGICGAGKMGLSLFDLLTRLKVCNVVLYARNKGKVEQLKKKYSKRLYLKGSVSEIETEENAQVVITDDMAELKKTAVVFEFVKESAEVKRDIIRTLVDIRENSEQIIASGSSSYTPDKLWQNYGDDNVFGVHFIYPAQFVKSVELVYGKDSDRGCLERLREFLTGIGKRPYVVLERIGVFTVGIMSIVQNEACNLFNKEGISPPDIDAIIDHAGFLAPPFAMMDAIGIDTVASSIASLYGDTEEFSRHKPMFDFLSKMIDKGDLGVKSGRGFYDYKTQRTRTDYADIPDDVIKTVSERLKLIYLNACMRITGYGSLDTVDMDEAMCDVYSNDKGPWTIALEMGLRNVLGLLEHYENGLHDMYFSPTDLLKYAVANDIDRRVINEQIRMYNMGGKKPDWYPEDI